MNLLFTFWRNIKIYKKKGMFNAVHLNSIFWLGYNSYFQSPLWLLWLLLVFSSVYGVLKWVIFVYVEKAFYNLQDFSVLPESIKHLFTWSKREGSLKCLFPVAQDLILARVLQNLLVWAKLGNILDILCSFIFDVWDLGLQWFILDISPGENVLEKGCTWQARFWQPFSGLHQQVLSWANFNLRHF